jgi:hypothetical protein
MVLQQSIDEVRLTQRNGWLVMRNSTNHPGSIDCCCEVDAQTHT